MKSKRCYVCKAPALKGERECAKCKTMRKKCIHYHMLRTNVNT